MSGAFSRGPTHAVVGHYGPNLAAPEPAGAAEAERLYTPRQEVNMTANADGTSDVSFKQNIVTTSGTNVNSPEPKPGGQFLSRW